MEQAHEPAGERCEGDGWIAAGALSACLAVVAGAFGAHALREHLAPEMLAAFETAARYQMYHALALVAVGSWLGTRPGPALRRAAWLFAAGTLLFSGSLYALALSGVRVLGAITPLGGVCFIAGWLSVAWFMVRARTAPPGHS